MSDEPYFDWDEWRCTLGPPPPPKPTQAELIGHLIDYLYEGLPGDSVDD